MTNSSITTPFQNSKIVIKSLCLQRKLHASLSTFSLNDKATLFEESIIPSGDSPSCVNKFVNYLMTSGKKGVAIALFAVSMRLFLKELRQDDRISGSERDSTIASPILSKKSSLESLLSTKSLFLLQKPSKNLLGLDFFAPSPTIDNYKKPFLFKSRKNGTLKAIPCFARKAGITEKPEVQEADISTALSRLVFYCQGPLSIRNRSIMSDKSSNVKSLQSFKNQRMMPLGLGSYRESRKAQFSLSLPLLNCLESALENVEPNLEIRKKKIAGITRQIPCMVSKSRGQGLAIRWVINAAQERRRRESQSLAKSLAEELINAYYKRGEPRQKRDSLHKLAESNRSFLRYRWW
jgi:small subunit ribosomal protein S7